MNPEQRVRIVTFEGFPYYRKLAELVGEGLGMPYEILTENHIGVCDEEGSCSSGMLGMLQRGEADIAAYTAPSSGLPPRNVVHSYPFNVDVLTFATRKQKVAPGIFSVFQPFSFESWLAILLSSVVMTLTLCAFLGKKRNPSEILKNVSFPLIGQSVTLKRRGEKLLMFPWLLGTMLLINCYLSLLLSALTIPRVHTIGDIEQLSTEVESQRYKVLTRLDGATSIIAASKEKSWKIIGNNALENKIPGGLKYYRLSENASLAYLDYKKNFRILNDNFHVSDDFFFFNLGHFPVRKSFCCHEKLTGVIQRIMSAGIFEKLWGDWTLQTRLHYLSMEMPSDLSVSPLTLTNLSGAFAVLISGHSIALACFVVELCTKHYKEMPGYAEEFNGSETTEV